MTNVTRVPKNLHTDVKVEQVMCGHAVFLLRSCCFSEVCVYSCALFLPPRLGPPPPVQISS